MHLVVFLRDMAGEKSPDEAVTLDGYTVFRGDRSARDSGKTRGGGTVIYVKHSWCTDCRIISKSCSENVEYLIFDAHFSSHTIISPAVLCYCYTCIASKLNLQTE